MNLENFNICEARNWLEYLIYLAILLLEGWLGKTNKTKSGSIIELIINILTKIIKFVKTSKPKNQRGEK